MNPFAARLPVNEEKCMKLWSPTFRRSAFVMATLLLSGSALAANYPLELVSPRAAGTFPSTDQGTPAMPSGHRIFYAYPGIPYNIRAVVIAGAYPYTFSLSNAPSGMTIDPGTGEINWPDPRANATPTITVTDAEGTTRSSPWTIQVTTSNFKFVDSVRGSDSNAGTLAAPWATLARVKAAASAGDIVYFRTGVYTTLGMETEGGATSEFNPPGNWQKVEITGGKTRLLAYPGESPVYDGGYVANQRQGNIMAILCTSTYPSYIEGFTLRNMWHMGVQFASGSCDYPVWRNLQFNGPSVGIDGANSSGIMATNSLTDPTYYSAYQRVSQTSADPGVMKMYSHKKHLWEDCDIRNTDGGPDQKMHVVRFEIRRCTIVNTSELAQGGLGGNMQFGSGGVGETSSGEIRFNLIDRRSVTDGWALSLNQNADSGAMFVYRNTFIGRVRINNASNVLGPFRIYQNVIINADPGTKVSYSDGSASDRVVVQDNLTGTLSSNMVDTQGRLTSAYQTYVGTRGHQIGTEIRPRPPTALSVQ
jgi:hypothetical protein